MYPSRTETPKARGLRDVLREWDIVAEIDDLERGFSFTRMTMDVHFRDQLEKFFERLRDWVRELEDLHG
jgi:hypothetical protein